MDCEPKKIIAVVSFSCAGRLLINTKFDEMPKLLQDIIKQQEELFRRMAERENRLRELSEEMCFLAERRDEFIPDYIFEEHLPLWRQPYFTERVNFRSNSSNFCRHHFRRARANLWSGQRKRQAADGE